MFAPVTHAVQLLEPLYNAVTFVMVSFHTLFKSIGWNPAGGWAWGLSIVGLVVVIRILLIPLFVKQIKAQRGLQLLQPEIKALQEKYKDKKDPESRQKQQQEMMKLYKDNGTNPLASCLPIVLQAPIFYALFHVLNGIGKKPPLAKGFLDGNLPQLAANAQIFGAHISDKFIGADNVNTQVVTALLIVAMSASTFLTQRQLMTKGMSAEAMTGSFAQQQKLIMYIFPLVFAISGVNFPIGVLLYWLTTNVWSMGQQFYVIRRNPAPGSLAAEELASRRAAKAAAKSSASAASGATGDAGATARDPSDASDPSDPGFEDGSTRPGGQRQQPKRARKKR